MRKDSSTIPFSVFTLQLVNDMVKTDLITTIDHHTSTRILLLSNSNIKIVIFNVILCVFIWAWILFFYQKSFSKHFLSEAYCNLDILADSVNIIA